MGLLLLDTISKLTFRLVSSRRVVLFSQARIFLCAPSLAKIVLGQDFSETGMPAAFNITEERLARLQGVLDAGLVKKSDGLALN